jgi:IS5 family transposase
MTAEQVLRALIVKQMNGFSYEELAFHLADSSCYRVFCRIGHFDKPPKSSTLQQNIKRLSPRTLEHVNRAVVKHAKEEGVESGRKVRIDSTGVESNIHAPTDSTLLWDVVRVLVRLMKQVKEDTGISFANHERRAKRRMVAILHGKTMKKRVPLYRDLLKVTEKTMTEAERVADHMCQIKIQRSTKQLPLQTAGLATELRHYVQLGHRIVDQARRRVLNGENVPVDEKLVSIFETHTDILVKGSRDVQYGHKVFLTTGSSCLILDCQIVDGNPADSKLACPMIQRHIEHFGQAPRQAAFDGGFASQCNVSDIKKMGVEDVAFSKRCGLAITEMVKSSWIYQRLRNFRAGVEGIISFFKRCFGGTRCTWKGPKSFKAYVWGSVLSLNLLVFARHRLAST